MANDLMVIGDNVKMELKQSAVAMPMNYSFENALKAAHLILKETVDRQKRPALDVCSTDSVHTAILDMAVQGLNPIKNQCYFVCYGNKLQMIRSYMGAQMVAKNVDNRISSIRAEVVYKGDNIKFSIQNGKKCIESHEQTLESMTNNEVIAAYAMSVDADDIVLDCDLMTIDEIKQAWKQSKVNPIMASGGINKDSTHGKFMGEMARRTVINRLCKKIINTSDDQMLIQASMRTDEETPTEVQVQKEISENANKKLIDITPQPQPEPKEKKEPHCNMNQAKQINGLEKKAGRDKSATLTYMSGFVDRKIEKYSDLTADEATEYISMLTAELADIPEENSNQEEPPW